MEALKALEVTVEAIDTAAMAGAFAHRSHEQQDEIRQAQLAVMNMIAHLTRTKNAQAAANPAEPAKPQPKTEPKTKPRKKTRTKGKKKG